MMSYSKWNKRSPINDVTAEQAKQNNPLLESEDSYLFYRDDGSIYDILPVSYLPDGGTVEARCEAFIAQLTAPEPKPLEELALLRAKVNALTEQNEMLENCIVEMAQTVYA